MTKRARKIRKQRGGRSVLGLLTTIAIAVVAGVGGYDMLTSEPNEIRLFVNLSSPAIAANDSFTLDVEIENVDVDIDSALQVNAVGLSQSLLNGVVVDEMAVIVAGELSVQPPGDWTDYALDHDLIGGGKMTIRYTLRATQPGTYQGEVSVWVNSELVLGVTKSKARSESVQIRVQ